MMKAAVNTGGNNFLDDVVYRVTRGLPGNLQNVTLVCEVLQQVRHPADALAMGRSHLHALDDEL